MTEKRTRWVCPKCGLVSDWAILHYEARHVCDVDVHGNRDNVETVSEDIDYHACESCWHAVVKMEVSGE